MRRFHRRRAKVGEFAHPFGAKRRPFVSGRVSRANPSAASGLPSKVSNDAMPPIRKTLIVPNNAMVSIYKTLVVPNDMMALTHKALVVSNDDTVSIYKTSIVPHEGMVSIHKGPIMPNEGTVFCLLVFGE